MNGALLLLVMLGAVAVTGMAHNRQLQPGLVIVLLASAVSFLPGLPRLELRPGFILGVVIPPLLFSAAYNAPFIHFLRDLRPILGLGVSLVVITTVVVGYITSWLLPALGLAGAFLLAAVVAPPDTVTSVTHGRDLGLTRRAKNILLGESLVNDAMALTLYALALSAVAGAHVLIGNPLLLFLYEAVVGTLIGLVLGLVGGLVRRRMRQPSLEVAFGFILPFAAYLSAEQVHASGILAVVLAAFTLSNNVFYDPRVHHPNTYVTRIKERAFWSAVDVLLEAFVFSYIGLQLRFVLEDLSASGEPFAQTVVAGVLILVVVMLLRVLWVALFFGPWRHRKKERWKNRFRRHPHQRWLPMLALSWQENLLIGWTGMRGIITLAAAAGVPLTLGSGAAWPGRAALQTVAFIVVVGTLVIQGSTLPYLSRLLHIDLSADDASEQRELEAAEQVVETALPGGYSAQRAALGFALRKGDIDEEAARLALARLDLEQAAQEAAAEV